MRNLTFRECQKYIETVKKETIFSRITGDKAKEILEKEDLDGKVLIITGKQNSIVVTTEDGFVCFRFKEDNFEQKEIIASLTDYYQESYQCSMMQIMPDQIIPFLEKKKPQWNMIHEEIDFELGFRLRKSYVEDVNVIFTIFYWPQGPILLCSKQNDQEVFQVSDFPDMDSETALSKLKEQWGEQHCSMQILRTADAKNDFLPAIEDDFDEDDFEEDDILVMEMEIPSKKQSAESEDKKSSVTEIEAIDEIEHVGIREEEIDEEFAEEARRSKHDDIRKALEESVVIREEELPEIGPDDSELLNRYGIDDKKTTFVFDDSALPMDQKIPELDDKELEIFGKYGINLEQANNATYQDIREVFEESVILKDDELPPLRTEDASILEKYGIMIKEEPISDQSVAVITKQEAEILQKCGLKLAHGEKSSLSMIRKSFQLAVAVKKLSPNIAAKDRALFAKLGLELPQKSILKRSQLLYIAIPIVLLLITSIFTGFYRSWQKKEQKHEVCLEQIKILTEQHGELKKEIQAVKSIEHKLKVKYKGEIKDFLLTKNQYPAITKFSDILNKMQIDLEVGQNAITEDNINEAFDALTSVEIRKIIEENWPQKATEWHKDIEKEVKFCQGILDDKHRYMAECHQEKKAINEILATMATNFPPEKGFPNPRPRVEKNVFLVQKSLNTLSDTIAASEIYLGKGNIKNATLLWEGDNEEHQALRQLQRIHNRLNATLELAQLMYESIANYKKVNKASRNLREHSTAIYQKLLSIKDVIEVIQDKYPVEKGFPELPEQTSKVVSKSEKRVKELTQMRKKIDDAFLTGKVPVALELAEPYLNLAQVDLSELEDLYAILQERMIASAKLAHKIELRRQGLQILKYFETIAEGIQAELREIEKGSQRLADFPAELEVPRPDQDSKIFINSARQEWKTLQQNLQQSRELISRDELETALQLLQSLQAASASYESLTLDLKQAKENVLDAIQIAKSTEKLSIQGREMAKLLRSNKEKLLRLEELTKMVSSRGSLLKNNYPKSKGFPSVKNSQLRIYKKAERVEKKLRRAVDQSMKLMEEKKLEQALELLRNNDATRRDAAGIIPKIEKVSQSLTETLAKCKEMASQRKRISIIRKESKKLENYLADLEQELIPLETKSNDLWKNYPATEGYPATPDKTKEIVDQGSNTAKKLHETLKEIKQMTKDKQFDDAEKKLEQLRLRGILNRDLITSVSKYRYQVSDLLYEAMALKKNKEKVTRIKELLTELTEREKGLTEIIPAFKETMTEMGKKYPVSKGFTGINEKTSKILLKDCEDELQLLSKIVADGREYFEDGRYEKAIELMNEFSRATNADITWLPALRTSYNQLKKIYQKNTDIPPEVLAEKQNLIKLREKWKKNQAFWFRALNRDMQEYEKMFPVIVDFVNDSGSHGLFTRSKVSMIELKRIPKKTADLEELLYRIKKNKASINKLLRDKSDEAMTFSQKEQIKLAREYVKKHKIELKITRHLNLLRTTVPVLKKSMNKKDRKATKEALKNIFKAFKGIEESYNEVYRPMHSLLLNLERSSRK